ncbi:hypothetical protein EYC84_006976 [Monilinia fructicola]|uniref:Uncharacterized protein n=1 Tax=Monilinia fructicola TaxID=38448 RepID=A0A5M9K944_MONFR|nr:hypothetical protein EYC84_006976 [Monilinia fructicola]
MPSLSSSSLDRISRSSSKHQEHPLIYVYPFPTVHYASTIHKPRKVCAIYASNKLKKALSSPPRHLLYTFFTMICAQHLSFSFSFPFLPSLPIQKNPMQQSREFCDAK